jgi:hypothetical protein
VRAVYVPSGKTIRRVSLTKTSNLPNAGTYLLGSGIDMGEPANITIVLGDEFDEVLRSNLLAVVKKRGAIQNGPAERLHGGSQDFESFEITLDGRLVLIEAETYIGLQITGPSEIVTQIANEVGLTK